MSPLIDLLISIYKCFFPSIHCQAWSVIIKRRWETKQINCISLIVMHTCSDISTRSSSNNCITFFILICILFPIARFCCLSCKISAMMMVIKCIDSLGLREPDQHLQSHSKPFFETYLASKKGGNLLVWLKKIKSTCILCNWEFTDTSNKSAETPYYSINIIDFAKTL